VSGSVISCKPVKGSLPVKLAEEKTVEPAEISILAIIA
jgi:hypothetical protein